MEVEVVVAVVGVGDKDLSGLVPPRFGDLCGERDEVVSLANPSFVVVASSVQLSAAFPADTVGSQCVRCKAELAVRAVVSSVSMVPSLPLRVAGWFDAEVGISCCRRRLRV